MNEKNVNYDDRPSVESHVRSRVRKISRVSRACAAIIAGSVYGAYEKQEAVLAAPIPVAATAPIVVRRKAFSDIDKAINAYAASKLKAPQERHLIEKISVTDADLEVSNEVDNRLPVYWERSTSDGFSRHIMPLGLAHNGALITGMVAAIDHRNEFVEGINTAPLYAFGIGVMAVGAMCDSATLRMVSYRAQLDNIDGPMAV